MYYIDIIDIHTYKEQKETFPSIGRLKESYKIKADESVAQPFMKFSINTLT